MTTTTTTSTVRIDGHTDDLDIDGFELASARRALALLKRNLGHERILDLLADEIADGDAFLRDGVQRSAGDELQGTTTLRAEGIGAAAFGAWLGRSFGREDVMLAAHPEHYVVLDGPRPHIVETLDEHVCSFFMGGWDASVEQDPAARRSALVLADGTVAGWVSTRFDDLSGDAPGFLAHLSVGLPAACGQGAIDQHLQHFAVEFRNWILRAAAETGA
jgi:hypothetical protein